MEALSCEEGLSCENAHALLRAVYQNPEVPLSVRMRAAIAALPFEAPKLAVTYQASEQDFATLLDARIERMKLIEQAKPEPTNGGKPAPQVEVKPPLPRVPDRRFRRI
jgi:hypothetical protein